MSWIKPIGQDPTQRPLLSARLNFLYVREGGVATQRRVCDLGGIIFSANKIFSPAGVAIVRGYVEDIRSPLRVLQAQSGRRFTRIFVENYNYEDPHNHWGLVRRMVSDAEHRRHVRLRPIAVSADMTVVFVRELELLP
jgi:hypothetical protein